MPQNAGDSQTSVGSLMITFGILVAAAIFFIVGIERQWTWLIASKTPYDVVVDLGILAAGIAVFNSLLSIHQTAKVDRFKGRLYELMTSNLPDETKVRLAHSDTLTTFPGLFRRARNNAADFLDRAGFAYADNEKVELATPATPPKIRFITTDELNRLRH